jgi:hypothetical protein
MPSPFINDDKQMDRVEHCKKLCDSIDALTSALVANGEQQKANCATKEDLKTAEARIVKAIKDGGGAVSPGIETGSGRLQTALNNLDSQVPDK